jgi:cytoskeletal protein RodZ
MKKVGDFLKSARIKKKCSLRNLEVGTKIKKEFLVALEAGDWAGLPDFLVVTGFVKSVASYLNVNEKMAQALLKRDYPPRKLNVGPKPDVISKFSWTPKHTFWAGVAVTMISVLVYLGLEYFKFVSPPSLEVIQPVAGIAVKEKEIIVSGKTDPDAVVKVNQQVALTDETGNFTVKLEILKETKEIVVEAVSRNGKKTMVIRPVIPDW